MVSIKPWDYTLIDIAQIFFQKSTKRRLALIDLIRDYIFLIRLDSTYTFFFLIYTRLHIFDSFDLIRDYIFLIRLDSTYTVFYCCYFILLYYLYSVIYCAFST